MCCGKKRAQLARSAPAAAPERHFFRYRGATSLTVAGPVSGKYYRFPAPGATVEADARDASSLVLVPLLERV